MSRIFGDLIQVGYVVRDIEASMRYWAETLGIGPWFYLPHLAIQDWRYRGQRCSADISLALSNSGAMQIELIQQHNTVSSIYRSGLPPWSEGIQHHLGFGSEDFDADVARYVARYGNPVQTGVTGSRGGFAYFETDQHPGTIAELIDLAHGRRELFAAIADVARVWDGKAPVRTELPI